jgi:hypothetical protein
MVVDQWDAWEMRLVRSLHGRDCSHLHIPGRCRGTTLRLLPQLPMGLYSDLGGCNSPPPTAVRPGQRIATAIGVPGQLPVKVAVWEPPSVGSGRLGSGLTVRELLNSSQPGHR